MFIKQLKISNFRCYEHLELNFDSRINVLFGENGSGKTSVLEAVYFLSTGKSFRSKRNKNLIKHETEGLSLFTHFVDNQTYNHQLGITLSKQLNKKVKLNQDAIKNQSQIAHVLPVVSIDPDSYLFLDKPPQYRRSFFDWLVFHVKPNYLQAWSKVSRCHKHLNILYKEKKTKDLEYWEQQYIQYAESLTTMRKEIFSELEKKVHEKINDFIPELSSLKLDFKKGWTQDNSLTEQISLDREKNLIYGNLSSGTHKMDIKNTIHQTPAHENLSRGQKKVISSIYFLSYIEILTTHLGVDPILCLDDMDAELDIKKTAVFSDFIQQSNNQVFITTVDKDKLIHGLKDAAMFHVEHNKITPFS